MQMRTKATAGLAGLLLPIVLLLVLLLGTLPSDAAGSTIGSTGAGDPYFPRQGNGGYNVGHYDIAISYRPATKHLSGHVRIAARATQALTRFDLDLRRNLRVSSVRVNGVPATYAQPKGQVQELVITPRQVLAAGRPFSVDVRYAGAARHVTDPDGSPDGFIVTNDGAFVASEPQGSPTWFPANDSPKDKATFAIAVTVPKGLAAVANGGFLGKKTVDGRTTWRWSIARPISTYLATATIGKFNVTRGRTASGIPYFNAVDPAEQAAAAPVLRRLPSIIEFFSKRYGAYPFGSAGAIVDNAHFVGYALETATRPVFDRAPTIETLSHELAHQWFGDDVTLRRWRDIWLNEGFAEFSSWLWDEHRGAKTAAQHLADLMSIPASQTGEWLPPPANPGSADRVFSASVYDRGAGTLEALRQKLGDRVFFRILRGWVRGHAYGNATVPQFTAYAQQVSHRDLTQFFQEWLYKRGKPTA
jgi:aminopeptidase N